MSPMIGESLSVTIQGENSQRILLMSNHKQWSSPMSATYENQALSDFKTRAERESFESDKG